MKNPSTNSTSTIQSKGKIKLLNPKREALTIEKLRQWPSFKNLSDEEAEDVKDSIEAYGRILYEILRTG